MIYGYARVSDEKMNEESQVDELEKFGCDELIVEKITGVAEDRKLVDLIKNRINENDTLVVLDVSRFGRSAIQSILLAKTLEDKGVNLVILKLGIDTRTPAGKLVFGIMSQLAEFERLQLRERQQRGIEFAKKKNKHLGRKREGWSDFSMKEAIKLYHEKKMTVKEISELTKVSKASLYRHLKKEI